MKEEKMKILALSIRQNPFDEIVKGSKKFEYREIRHDNVARYANFFFETGEYAGKEFRANDLPEDADTEKDAVRLVPVKYDALKLLTGSYSNKRPYIIVEVKNALIFKVSGQEGVTLNVEYRLGAVFERSEY